MSGEPSALDSIPGYGDFLSKLTERFKDMPPCPIFASGALFPTDHAWSFKIGNQEFMLANEAFWRAVPTHAPTALTLFTGIPIIDIDDPRNETTRDKVMGAIVEHLHKVDAAKQ